MRAAPIEIRIVVKNPLRVFVVARLVYTDRESRRQEAVYWQRVPELAWLGDDVRIKWLTLRQLVSDTSRAARRAAFGMGAS